MFVVAFVAWCLLVIACERLLLIGTDRISVVDDGEMHICLICSGC